ncbi:MAG: hypothetical protein RQM90_05420 [Methanoculleus sp.]
MSTENKPGWLLGMVITTAYLWMVFMIGVIAVYLYSLVLPTDFATVTGAAIVVAIFAGVVTLDLVLLVLKKITPAIIAMVVVISPCLAVYRLLRNADLLVVDTDTPDRIAKYVFHRGIFYPRI